MKYIFIFIFSFFNLIAVLANENPVDSLKQLLESTEDKKEKAILYCSIAKRLEHSELDTALYYAGKGLFISEQIDYTIGIAENSAALGDLYIINNQLKEAKEKYYIASENFRKSNEVFDHAQILMLLGNIHLAQELFIDALTIYHESLNISLENDFTTLISHLYNNIGEIFLKIQNYKDASPYFTKAYILFLEQDDYYSAAFCLGNIAAIKRSQGNYDEAIKDYLDNVRFYLEKENWEDMAITYNSISDIYWTIEEYKKAKDYISMALSTIENYRSDMEGPSSIYITDIYTMASKIYFYEKEYELAMHYAKNSLSISYPNSFKKNAFSNAKIISQIFDEYHQTDSALYYYKIFIKYYEEYQDEYNVRQLIQLKMQNEFEATLQKNKLEETKRAAAHERKELIYIGILIISILLILILISRYINQKAKKENLELEKTKLNQDLSFKNKELATNMMYLLEKNEFITTISKKLIDLKSTSNQNNQNIIQQLIIELRKNASNKVWDEFELRFKNVHSEFYDALNSEFPDLTPNEKKICAFLRLNMSTKEISAITHQSIKSINMARFRLRKKLNIEQDENLISYLSQL